MRLAETLPDAAFLGLDRLADDGAAARARLDADPALKSRVDQTLAWLVEDGAHGVGRLDRPARRTGSRRPGHPGRRHGGTGLGPGHPGSPDRPPAPPRPARARSSFSRAPAQSWTWPPLARTRQSSSAPPITARRPASPPIPAPRATRQSQPVWPRPRCGRGPKASSPGGRMRRDALSAKPAVPNSAPAAPPLRY